MAKQATVLVVEDDPCLRAVYADLLSDEGFHVETAENGQVGITMVEKVPPDVILLDIEMPVMDGVTFATIYNRMSGDHAPIVVCSSLASTSSLAQIRPASVMGKPCDLDQLLNEVNRQVPLAV